jgi:hypothetical protein
MAAPDEPEPINKPIRKAAAMRKICARIVIERLVRRQARFLLFAPDAVMLQDR